MCQVMKIGVRVTQLYDIGAHAVIYAPNNKLANERLVNLMQPTPELMFVVPVIVGQDNDPERVRGLLSDVLLGHPDLLGDLEAKLERIDGFLTLTPEKRAHGRERLAAERRVDEAVRAALAGLQEFRSGRDRPRAARLEPRGADGAARTLSTAGTKHRLGGRTGAAAGGFQWWRGRHSSKASRATWRRIHWLSRPGRGSRSGRRTPTCCRRKMEAG